MAKSSPTQHPLQQFVEDYRLEIDGIKFWVPYWRNELPTVEQPVPPTGPYKGKGTPPQLLHTLQGYLQTSTQRRPSNGEDYRKLMRELHLGVDCSGFAYYVWELWLAKQGITLADHLFKPRADLLADFDNPVYTHPPKITRKLLESLSEQVSLAKIHELWGNEPVRLAGVIYLTSPAATIAIDKAGEAQAGDIIGMKGKDGIGHCVVVIEHDGQEIRYAHSRRTSASELGGVEYGTITVIDPKAPIVEQYWERSLFEGVQSDSISLRRLKVLADGAARPR